MDDLSFTVLVIDCAARQLQELICQDRGRRRVNVSVCKRQQHSLFKLLVHSCRFFRELDLMGNRKPLRKARRFHADTEIAQLCEDRFTGPILQVPVIDDSVRPTSARREVGITVSRQRSTESRALV